jgi:hypothetical protein
MPTVDLLISAYTDYVKNVSTPGMAISLEASIFLYETLVTVQPKSVLDTGSGFTSYVVRRWAQDAGLVSSVNIVSADDNASWLKRTRSFCTKYGVEFGAFLLWDDIKGKSVAYDLISHDLGNKSVRAEALTDLLKLCAEGGTIIFDDMHKPELNARTQAACAAAKFSYVEVQKQTLDKFGRFQALGTRLPAAQVQ